MTNGITPKTASKGVLSGTPDQPMDEPLLFSETSSTDSNAPQESGDSTAVEESSINNEKEKTKIATDAIKTAGAITKDPKQQELIEENVGAASKKKKKAVKKSLDDASFTLREKTKVKLIDKGKTVKTVTKTGKLVVGSLEKNEKSKTLTASDGSKVLLVDSKIEKSEVAEQVTNFVGDVISSSAENNGIIVDYSFLEGLSEFMNEFMQTAFGEFFMVSYFVPKLTETFAELSSVIKPQPLLDAKLRQYVNPPARLTLASAGKKFNKM